MGKPRGDLPTAQFSPALVQRLIDKIAAEGTPSKANHLLRYLGRLFRWRINRGYCDRNPAQGVESAKERKQRRLPELTTIARLTEFAVIFNPVVQMAALKQPFYYARFPALSLG
ncbi:phage integrase central domain-containing protein [Vreelandella titanicae]|uniref:phage integrase central domain-containing protein n=1 Tax=Vreelandella titanicae TaxID=664683 RepID=UPI003BF61493